MPCFSQLLCPGPALHISLSSIIYPAPQFSCVMGVVEPSPICNHLWNIEDIFILLSPTKKPIEIERGESHVTATLLLDRNQKKKTVWKTSWIFLLAFMCLGMQVVFLIAVLMISSLAVLSWEFLIALYAFWIRMAFLYFISFLVMSHPRRLVNCSMLSLCPRSKP